LRERKEGGREGKKEGASRFVTHITSSHPFSSSTWGGGGGRKRKKGRKEMFKPPSTPLSSLSLPISGPPPIRREQKEEGPRSGKGRRGEGKEGERELAHVEVFFPFFTFFHLASGKGGGGDLKKEKGGIGGEKGREGEGIRIPP